MAWRNETWMLTSTVRNSGLANIMRTGSWSTGTPRWLAASDCNNSVWPGKLSPAAAKAVLFKGAVTTACT